jgi:hypothetical protein
MAVRIIIANKKASVIMGNKKYIKSEKGYAKIEYDIKKSKEAQGKISRKTPTTISLSHRVNEELK